MSRKDGVLALLVVVVWGLNFVVIKVGLHNMPPLMLAGLRFMLVAFPAIFFVTRPKVPLNLLLGYGLTISFAQFAFLFCAINFGMPAGLASLVLQAQAFFTIVLGAFTFGERLHGKQLAGIALAIFGVLVLIEDSLNGQHVAMLGFMLTLAAAFSWACGNIFNKKIMSHATRPAVMSLVIWSALIPIIPFFVASLILDGSATMIHSLVTIDMTTILSLMYLAFVATIVGYGIWGTLLGRYETWRVAPLSLLVPVNTGQVCAAAKRFIIEEGIASAFTERFVAAAAALKMGDPRDEENALGPMARFDLRDELHHQVEKTLAQGARLLLGGEKMAGAGNYYPPTVLANVTPEMTAFREEMFGPVAAITIAKDAEHALELANDSEFGLSATIFTTDETQARQMAARLECGGVFINGYCASDARVAFGGVKKSGFGRELSHFGLHEFCNIQTVWKDRV